MRARLKRGNQVLFGKDSAYLQDLALLLREQEHRAVVLWALHRGNRAALVVFCLIGLEQIAAFSYWILPRYQEAMAPVDSLGSASLVLTVIDLVLRLIVLYQMFSGSTVPMWLECRRDMRRRKDLILELALFGVSILTIVVLIFLTL